jgi:SNF2 family DNA or RNA helicase
MNTQKLEQVPIDKLVPYARNARTHSKEQIAQLRASLREFGFVSPAVIDADYNILVGHGRIEAARAEGYENVPCVFAENLTEAQKRAYILADNQLALNAGWDEEMLAIYRRISDITISMKSTDHLKMPELISTQYEVELSDAERDRYENLKQELILQLPDGEITAANAAALTGKLSQLANGAIYSDTGEIMEFHDRKLDALEDIIEAANEKPLLVAYWFRHDLARIKNRFNVREIKTSRDIADWNAGKIPVAVIHPASAGHGLNLQAGGSTLVWFGLTWSLELYQQTNARLWRQGQQSHTVVIQHIITKGTIDERILKALSKKELTQSALIDAVKVDLEVPR